MAVAIIVLGSLINFHQYKIWGKPLIPNFVGYKRDIEKYSKALSFSKFSRDNQNIQNDYNGNEFDVTSDIHPVPSRTVTLITSNLSQKVPVTTRLTSSGLRGPPIS
jgi:hypothetical protein